MSPRILVAFGTRPELIKMVPVIKRIETSEIKHEFLIVNTSQHTGLMKKDLAYWNIQPDITFTRGNEQASLVKLLASHLDQFQDLLEKFPSLKYVVVQGDTNTALACANFAFLNKLKLLHIEAGLRTFDLSEPFPEEYNRVCASKTAYLHFAPTELAQKNLIAEGITKNKIAVTGNTVIDTLIMSGMDMHGTGNRSEQNEVIITLHRREKSNRFFRLKGIVERLSEIYPQLKFRWIVHPNYPADVVGSIHSGESEILFNEPLGYADFIRLYNRARIIITDSGGVTEEASQLGIPVVVFRKKTEREEPLLAGHPMIVSLDEKEIERFFAQSIHLARKPAPYFGNGNASEIIFNRIKQELEIVHVNTAIIGGGPAGTGTVLKAMKDGTFEQYVENGIAIIEKRANLIVGSISDYYVNSDTVSDVFLECLEGSTGKYLDVEKLAAEIEFIRGYKGHSIPLHLLKSYLLKLSALLQERLQHDERCQLFLNTNAERIDRCVDGSHLITLDTGRQVHTKHIILAPGATPKNSTHNGYMFNGKIRLSKYSGKSVTSDELIRAKQDDTLNSLKKNSPAVVILGGNHSAFSSAHYLLSKKEFDFTDDSIIIWTIEKPKIFYSSAQEAIAEGYHDFNEHDICPVTNRVYRLAGLRMDGRELYKNMLGLGNTSPEKRVVMKLFKEQVNEMEKDMERADILIHALGYTFECIPIFDEEGNEIGCAGTSTGKWVNNNCRLLKNDGTVIENIFAMGLAAGFVPGGKLGGEPSFKGQTNGLWYYQNVTAELIIQQILDDTI